MKKYILLFFTLSPTISLGQDQVTDAIPDRVRGYDLVERYHEGIKQRGDSPERIENRKRIEEDFRLRLERFYKEHPQLKTQPQVSSLPTDGGNTSPVNESPQALTTVADNPDERLETVTVLKPEFQTGKRLPLAAATSEERPKFNDSNLKQASMTSDPSFKAGSPENALLLLPDLVSDLGRMERQLQELEDRLKRLEGVQ